MDYSKYSEKQIEAMLDALVQDYANGDMHHSLYTIQFNELYEALAKKQSSKESLEDAYERAMRGIF